MFCYMDIYNTAGRFLKRIRNTDRGNIDYEDDLHAYFVFCYHLKDYIIKDAKLSAQVVDNYIKSEPYLKLCRNICNLIKHRTPKGADYGVGHIEINVHEHISISNITAKGILTHINDLNDEKEKQIQAFLHSDDVLQNFASGQIEGDKATIDQHYDIIDTTGTCYDALDVAENCYELWTTFLRSNNLL